MNENVPGLASGNLGTYTIGPSIAPIGYGSTSPNFLTTCIKASYAAGVITCPPDQHIRFAFSPLMTSRTHQLRSSWSITAADGSRLVLVAGRGSDQTIG